MTDEEIEKKLEIYSKTILNYINRLKAENDRLNGIISDLSETIKEYETELARR